MAENSSGKPYEIIDSGEGWEVRLFRNEDPSELFWHRDKEDREIHLIYGDVKLQIDNQMPVRLNIGKIYNIQSMVYHRVISNGPFIIKIYKKGDNYV